MRTVKMGKGLIREKVCRGMMKQGNGSINGHHLSEITRIDDPYSDKLPGNVKIYVCGEDDEQGREIPHFHIVGENFEYEMFIRHIQNLDIWRPKLADRRNNADAWDGRTEIREAVSLWLDRTSTEFAPMTNADIILAQWNLNNPGHKIPRSLKD